MSLLFTVKDDFKALGKYLQRSTVHRAIMRIASRCFRNNIPDYAAYTVLKKLRLPFLAITMRIHGCNSPSSGDSNRHNRCARTSSKLSQRISGT